MWTASWMRLRSSSRWLGRAGVSEGRAGGGGRGLGFAAGELGAGGERVVGGAGVGGHAGVTGAVVVGSPDAVR